MLVNGVLQTVYMNVHRILYFLDQRFLNGNCSSQRDSIFDALATAQQIGTQLR